MVAAAHQQTMVETGIRRSSSRHPVTIMLFMIVLAAGLTFVLPSGLYNRSPTGAVEPGSFHFIAKDRRIGALFSGEASSVAVAAPASVVTTLKAIPAGLTATASLIFMITFIGGAFAVFRNTGALDAGLDRLLALTGGRVRLLIPLLMLTIAFGASFVGLISEYIAFVPVAVALGERLGFNRVLAAAIVIIPAKIGYLTSVTNPIGLVVAQTAVGVPVFSGLGVRLAAFVILLSVGVLFVLHKTARLTLGQQPISEASARRLSHRHLAILLTIAVFVLSVVYGVRWHHWGHADLAAAYIGLATAIALIARIRPTEACQLFLEGMKAMLLAGVLVGLAKAVELILRDAMVLDPIIFALTSRMADLAPPSAAACLMTIEMIVDLLVPSTSGRAALTMPLFAPVAALSGVSGQSVVLAFLFGGGLPNLISPTSPALLAFLSVGRVRFGEWVRFIIPLFATMVTLCLAILLLAVEYGYR